MHDPVLALFTESLGIDEPWYVSSVEFSRAQKRLDIQLDYRKGAKFPCSECGGTNTDIYDRKEHTWRHVNYFEHQTHLHARVPRVWCHDCSSESSNGVRLVNVPWSRKSSHFTKLFEAYVIQLAREMSVSSVGRLVGERDKRIWRIIQHYVQKARDKEDFSNVSRISIDETSVARGHQYVTVVADIDERKVLFVTPGKDAATVEAFAKDFRSHKGHPENVTTVSCDMSPAFITGTKQVFPNATITFDKFHVVKVLSEAVDAVRRDEQRKHPELKRSRYVWLKNPNKLTAAQSKMLSTLSKQNLKTVRAYHLQMNFKELWQQPKVLAKPFLDKWYFWATHSRLRINTRRLDTCSRY
ncbi:ISL3 family transposase [Alicyclobacillus herbarius]|uniref:ISL3 family transposase n=1 Tax=Alicyclobacillus herbarius TaxID=122960 RepID=UPI0003FFD1D1|nr:ISL3 family transposase [Alicyclobacillus herbarius]